MPHASVPPFVCMAMATHHILLPISHTSFPGCPQLLCLLLLLMPCTAIAEAWKHSIAALLRPRHLL
eukprot:2518976-Rhodomonas_salina.1